MMRKWTHELRIAMTFALAAAILLSGSSLSASEILQKNKDENREVSDCNLSDAIPETDRDRYANADMNGSYGYGLILGIVKGSSFHLLSPRNGTARLTGIQMQEARTPESDEINLTEYEGQAIMVRGIDGGGWIYSAKVIDHAGPILTAVVEHVFY